MKTLFAALLVSSLVLAGCSESTMTPGDPYYVTASVDGQSFEAETYEASYKNDVLTIDAHAGTSQPDIHIQLTGIEMREYNLGDDLRNEASISFGSPENTYWSKFHIGEGRVLITRLVDTEAQGTFWFKGMSADSQTVDIQQGRFSVYFNE